MSTSRIEWGCVATPIVHIAAGSNGSGNMEVETLANAVRRPISGGGVIGNLSFANVQDFSSGNPVYQEASTMKRVLVSASGATFKFISIRHTGHLFERYDRLGDVCTDEPVYVSINDMTLEPDYSLRFAVLNAGECLMIPVSPNIDFASKFFSVETSNDVHIAVEVFATD